MLKSKLFPIDKIPRKKIILTVSILLVYLILPLWVCLRFQSHPYRVLFIFYITNIILAGYIYRRGINRAYKIVRQKEVLQEKINVQEFANSKDLKFQEAMRDKIKRYLNLKEVLEKTNESLTLESIAEHLTASAFFLISSCHGNCILYLLDKKTNALNIFKAQKQDKELIIKAKQGDIFDYWVLRHSTPLLIEDVHKDFRFDLEKLKDDELRSFSSLISAPLISGGSVLGVLRLDSKKANFFGQEDLRFLATISELGAVALENGQLYQNTEDLATHDGLTSLYTKGHFMELLELEFKRTARNQKPFSLIMVDIDDFKSYNDRYGHIAGDLVLKNISQNINDIFCEPSAISCRFGGEEFCILLPNTDKDKAVSYAEQLKEKVSSSKVVLRRNVTFVTVSVGVASFPVDSKSPTELIMRSDKAMYEAKQKGKNRVVSA